MAQDIGHVLPDIRVAIVKSEYQIGDSRRGPCADGVQSMNGAETHVGISVIDAVNHYVRIALPRDAAERYGRRTNGFGLGRCGSLHLGFAVVANSDDHGQPHTYVRVREDPGQPRQDLIRETRSYVAQSASGRPAHEWAFRITQGIDQGSNGFLRLGSPLAQDVRDPLQSLHGLETRLGITVRHGSSQSR